MRDFDRVRDKIEIRLEPRQVVMLAGATMLFSGLLFAAGFMLGRSRAPAPAPAQPLAVAEPTPEAPDTATRTTRASAIGEVEFRFPSALGSRPGRARSERPAMKLDGEVVAARADEAAAAKPEPAKPEPAEPEPVAKPEPAAKPEPVKPEPAAKPDPAPRARPEPIAAAPALRPIAPARAEPVADDRVDMPPLDEDDPDAAPPPAPAAPAAAKATPDAPGARYTLQVKAARDKAEADAFIAELRAAGFTPHIVLADIPGKGRFYRVRVGRFASMGDARAFQRRYKVESGQPDGGFVTDL